IRRCITSLGLVASLLYPFTIAHAQDRDRITIIAASPDEARRQATVFTFLQEYFSALAQGQVDKIATYHPTLTPQQLDIFVTTLPTRFVICTSVLKTCMCRSRRAGQRWSFIELTGLLTGIRAGRFRRASG